MEHKPYSELGKITFNIGLIGSYLETIFYLTMNYDIVL